MKTIGLLTLLTLGVVAAPLSREPGAAPFLCPSARAFYIA
jgi:hypothetical protein